MSNVSIFSMTKRNDLSLNDFIRYFPVAHQYNDESLEQINEMSEKVLERYGFDGLKILFKDKNIPDNIKNSMFLANQYSLRVDNTLSYRSVYHAFSLR